MRFFALLLTLLAFAASAMAAEPTASQARIPVILDTDIGDDIDDTWCLGMLLAAPQVDLKLIVTATDNTPEKTRLTAKLLEAMGRTDVPLGTGVKENDKKHHQMKWVGDYKLDQYKGKIIEDGVQAMVDMIKASPTTITLCVIGPQTNIAEALRRDPSIAQKARIVSMFGGVYKGYGGSSKMSAEYNVKRDIKAAQAVFAASWPITIAPLDSCGLLTISGERYNRLAASDAPRAKAVIENYDQWANRAKYAKDASSVLYDTVAAYLCWDEKFCGMKTVKLIVDDKGFTPPNEEKGRPVNCALTFTDRVALEELIVRLLTEK